MTSSPDSTPAPDTAPSTGEEPRAATTEPLDEIVATEPEAARFAAEAVRELTSGQRPQPPTPRGWSRTPNGLRPESSQLSDTVSEMATGHGDTSPSGFPREPFPTAHNDRLPDEPLVDHPLEREP